MADKNWKGNASNSGGWVYFLAFIGAVVYYIQHADSFGDGLLGILKAFIWPAILIYKAMETLGM